MAEQGERGLDRAMTSVVDLHVYRAARLFLKKHGADLAPMMAAKRLDAMLEYGDAEGQRMWTAVLRAVQELTGTGRGREIG